MRKFRIVMVGACPYPVPQGSQVLLRNTAEALYARGHDVRLVVYAHGTGGDPGPCPVERARGLPGIGHIQAGPYPTKPLLDLLLLAKLRQVVRSFRPDIVHAHNYEALIAALALGYRPVVYHAHNAMGDELPHFLKGGGPLGRWLDRTFPRRADHVIAPHERLREYLVACGCAPERVTVVPPSMDVDAFEPPRVQEGLAPVLYFGNFDRYQNLALLERAMARVRQEEPEARLIVATAQEGRIAGAEMAPAPDFAALRRVMAIDGVAACPRVSWSGYPIKVVNAMAAGKPVVACRGAAYPVRDGETGLIVPDNDEQAFAQALWRLMRDAAMRKRFGLAARDRVRAEMAPDVVAKQVEEVYDLRLTIYEQGHPSTS